ncbi:MAG: hypothetical protein QW165_04780 [Candidatus Woesearchaeota archaeon]
MVEFISEENELARDEPSYEPEQEPVQVDVRALDELVEEQLEELHALQGSQEYFDEPSIASGEYHQPEHKEVYAGPELKHELKPLVYEDNEQIVVIDIFEKYGQKNEKWWEKNSDY